MKRFPVYTIPCRLLAVLALSLVAGLAGCGGGGDTTTAPSVLDNPTNALFVFVDNTHRASTPLGTKEAPYHDIQTAIDCAAVVHKSVCVAEGTYLVDQTTYIQMADNVSIYGGYHRNLTDNVWTRNVAAYMTKIQDRSASGGTNRAIDCGYGATGNFATIDGFTVMGGGGNYSAAIYATAGSSVTVRRCILVAGAPVIQGVGIYNYTTIAGSDIVVDNCTITGGGSGCSQTLGIYHIGLPGSTLTVTDTVVTGLRASTYSWGLNASYGRDVVTGCDIAGGTVANTTSGETCGMYVNQPSTALVEGNTIHGGDGGRYSYGVRTMNAEGANTYRNNAIDGGSGTSSYGFYFESATVCPTIDANDFSASGGTNRYGIYEAYSNALPDFSGSPTSVRNNTFRASLSGAATRAYYRDYTDGIPLPIYEIGTLNALGDGVHNPLGSVSSNFWGADP